MDITETAAETASETKGETPEVEQQENKDAQSDATEAETSEETPDPLKGLKSALSGARSDLSKERKEHQASKARLSELETQVADLSPKAEATDAVQSRYDRLEEFLQALPGPLGKALDSKSFTRRLFDTDDDIASLVKDWQKANPSATSSALSSTSAEPKKSGPTMNEILRAAHGG